jgi:serine/threonine-protein kinase HipA
LAAHFLKKSIFKQLVEGYFRLNKEQMETIIQEVLQATSNWKIIASEIGISKGEQELMVKAFNS